MVLDLYAQTLLIFNHADPPAALQTLIRQACDLVLRRLPWIKTVMIKTRAADQQQARWGEIVMGGKPDSCIRENDVRYAIDLTLQNDASFYLDTRLLRKWAKDNLAGKSVLNTFAYTGSLGVAARAGGASRVVHLDLNRRFLNLARQSYALNGFAANRADFLAGDFFPLVSRMRRQGALFDCVLLDPPFFSSTARGSIDLLGGYAHLVNKVRPLINHDGWLVAVNNALYLSGKDYLHTLDQLCADGYLTLETILPVPADITGYPDLVCGSPPVDPAPFNHPTKIAVLRVRRKGKET